MLFSEVRGDEGNQICLRLSFCHPFHIENGNICIMHSYSGRRSSQQDYVLPRTFATVFSDPVLLWGKEENIQSRKNTLTHEPVTR